MTAAYSIGRFGKPRPLRALLLAGVAACGSEPCILPPCLAPIALQLDVRSEASGNSVSATVAVGGAEMTSVSCNGTCVVHGRPGTYELDVSAPGYVTLHKTVQVDGVAAPKCGCVTSNTQLVSISLVAASS